MLSIIHLLILNLLLYESIMIMTLAQLYSILLLYYKLLFLYFLLIKLIFYFNLILRINTFIYKYIYISKLYFNIF